MRATRQLVQALPLIGVFALLRFLPTLAVSPINRAWPLPWRLDALALVWLLALASAMAFVPLDWHGVIRGLIALALLLPAAAAEHLIALPLGLIAVGLLLRNGRWIAASLTLTIGLALLRLGGGATWSDPRTAAALTSPIFLLLLAATCAGINCYPVSLIREHHDPLRLALQPVWLLPLLRTVEWGPWNSGWALATLLLGSATTLVAGASALWSEANDQRVERIAGTWLGMTLACIGLLTPVGLASALWQVLTFGTGLGLLLRPGRLSVWAAPLPPTATFVACWLAQGAAASSGVFLLAAVLWLAAITSGLAVFRTSSIRSTPSGWPSAILLGLSLLFGLLAPLPLRWLIVPAVDLVQGGLTPFGLLDIWPWVGIAALDAGQRRVAVLPSIAVAVLALVVAALVWLLARLLSWAGASADASATDGEHGALNWAEVRQRVWWAGRPQRRG